MTTGQILKNSVDSLKNSQAGYATTKGVGLDLQYEYMEKLTLFAGYNAGVLEDNKTQNINAGFKYVF